MQSSMHGQVFEVRPCCRTHEAKRPATPLWATHCLARSAAYAPKPPALCKCVRGDGYRLAAAQVETVPAQQQQAAEAPPKERVVPVDSVDSLPLAKGVTLLRGVCRQRLKLEVEYGMKRGTTDNVYLIEDHQSKVLLDVPDVAFWDKFEKALEGVAPIRELDTVVLTSVSKDRIASLANLLQRRRGRALDVHLSNPAARQLKDAFERDEGTKDLLGVANLKIATSGDTLLVGDEGLLRLIPTPTPRWPDLLCAFHAPSRLLFTSQLFAAHVAPAAVGEAPNVVQDEGGWDTYGQDWRFYFDCMISPIARQAAAALEKLEVVAAPAFGRASIAETLVQTLRAAQSALEGGQSAAFGSSLMAQGQAGAPMVVSALCPAHGPVVQRSLTELLAHYREWMRAQMESSAKSAIAVIYASAYGNTASLAQAISRGISKAGVGVETLNLESESLEDVLEAVGRCNGFVIGSPTLGGHMPTQVATALGAILRDERARQQPCGVFGSFGWSGEAVDELDKRLRDAGFRFAFDTMRVKFKPTGADMQVAEESGTDIAQAVLRALKKREKQKAAGQSRTAAANDVEQAVGRLVGSLCAVTAADEEGTRSAMLASWISQASFDPPGLSLAVKKDRAIETLLQPGGCFVVNILAEEGHKRVAKALLRPFKPGDDRFEGLETQELESGAGIVLPGTAAYLECTIQAKMEAGDHWVVYATVKAGKVVEEGALSAVHHRKTGTTY